MQTLPQRSSAVLRLSSRMLFKTKLQHSGQIFRLFERLLQCYMQGAEQVRLPPPSNLFDFCISFFEKLEEKREGNLF